MFKRPGRAEGIITHLELYTRVGEERQHIHLDSSALKPYVDKDDELHHEMRDIVSKALGAARMNPTIHVILSPLALGEVISSLAKEKDEKDFEDCMYRLYRLCREKGVSEIGWSREVPSIAIELLRVDERLQVSDALILAFALADEDAVKLITLDTVLLTSKRIQEFIVEGGFKLKIVSEF